MKIRRLEYGSEKNVYTSEICGLLRLYDLNFSDVWELVLSWEVFKAKEAARDKVLTEWGVINGRIIKDRSQSKQTGN